jgi:bacillolysin
MRLLSMLQLPNALNGKTAVLLLTYILLGQLAFSQTAIPYSVTNQKPTKAQSPKPTRAQYPTGIPDWLQAIPKTSHQAIHQPSQSLHGRLDIAQLNQVLSLQKQDPALVLRQNKSGTVRFLEGSQLYSHPQPITDSLSAVMASYAALEHLKNIMLIQNPAAEFVPRMVIIDQATQNKLPRFHVRMDQRAHSMPVWASDIVLHFEGQQLYCLNGQYQPTPTIESAQPRIPSNRAVQYASDNLHHDCHIESLSPFEQELLKYTEPLVELIILPPTPKNQAPTLCYHITIRSDIVHRWEYFVDAQTGDILRKYLHSCSNGPTTARAQTLNGASVTLNTYEFDDTFYLIDASREMFNARASTLPNRPVGTIWTIDARNTAAQNLMNVTSTNNRWSNLAASAHHNAGLCYEYYRSKHNRNAIDGKGGNMMSVINVANQDGSPMENAYWNGQIMAYGNGGRCLKPLAGSLDVAGHEMTHGVISATANLEYLNQQGAINESFADVFGCMIEGRNWQLGEEIVERRCYPSGAMRDLANPNQGQNSPDDNGWQPARMRQFQRMSEEENNGGVHVNSGIPNHAYYLFATAIGREKAELIYYKALTEYLTRSSQFLDLRFAIVRATQDLFGTAGTEVDAARKAFDDVEIFDGTPPVKTGDLKPLTGRTDVIVHTLEDASAEDQGIYVLPARGGVAKVSSTEGTRISLLDNGTAGYFVNSENGLIHSIQFNELTNPDERFFSRGFFEGKQWRNVAISKDGQRMAMVSRELNNQIIVYDFARNSSQSFELYNPTFTQGVNGGTPLYADVLEWDLTGEHLIYDALTSLNNEGGSDIEFWDIGIIQVWDNAAKNWGNGRVDKLFNDVEEGYGIGNPSPARNSTSLLTFEVLTADFRQFITANMDIESNDVVYAEWDVVMKRPAFNNTDDSLFYDGTDNRDRRVIWLGPLAEDQLTLLAEPRNRASFCRWAQPLVQGTRPLPTSVNKYLSEPLASDALFLVPNPANESVKVQLRIAQAQTGTIYLYNLNGSIVFSLPAGNLTAGQHEFQLDGLNGFATGVYFVRFQGSESTFNQKLIIE